MSDSVLFEREGAVAKLTINRPDKLNALDVNVVNELGGKVIEISEEPDIRAVVLTGAGKACVAGADIQAMSNLEVEQARTFSALGHQVFAGLENLHCPLIAAVNGFALGGGCELALACDFIYASEKASFGQPEVKLGVIPGFGGTQRLLRRVGVGHARELIYGGAVIDAQEALRIGLANKVFAPEELVEASMKMASTIAKRGPLAVGAAKRVMREGEGRLLPAANELEVEAFAQCFATADQKAGMAAFLAKEKVAFKGE